MMQEQQEQQQKQSTVVKTILWGTTGAVLLTIAVTAPFLIVPWLPKKRFGALPYMSTPNESVGKAIQFIANELAKKRAGSSSSSSSTARPKLIDLGSGDGRVAIAAAKAGFEAEGVELNPVLLTTSRLKALTTVPWKLRPSFRFRNMWTLSLSSYDVVWCFGVQSFMDRLKHKIAAECRDDVMIAMFRFQLPDVTPLATFGEVNIYQPNLAKARAANSGTNDTTSAAAAPRIQPDAANKKHRS